ncbi:hypothetical protein NK638_06475 [Psychrobacter sp. A3]|uniref:hypothetical protein n=1 Tax=Psychrobacter sp. A3 TaxID=2992754 RepID=UPI00237AA35D|nr:hypothetical protein [Psychrobacter sp. A3]MDE0491182.1 hypothetical protein [Psychrobacter sp. A3]
MTDLNKPNRTATDSEIAAKQHTEATEVNRQQVSIKVWSQKLLVVILCVASFYGGWKSYESNMVNECTANGGKMIEGQRTMLCQSLQ